MKTGPEAEPFNLHKDLLCECSAYFRKAFNGSFKEAQERCITLSDLDPKTFRVFMDWLYYQELAPPEQESSASTTSREKASTASEEDESSASEDSEDSDSDTSSSSSSDSSGSNANSTTTYTKWDYDSLLKLYVFGDRYDVPELRRVVVDAWKTNILVLKRGIPDWTTITSAYEQLHPESSLCRLLVQMTAYEWKAKAVDDAKDLYNLPNVFLAEVMMIMRRRLPYRLRNEKVLFEKDACFFHEHKDEDEAKSCRKSSKRK